MLALVIDDEAAIRRLVSRILERSGFAVAQASDGAEAISSLSDGLKFNVIVLDLMMPKVDGFGVITHLQHSKPELLRRTLVITAYPREAVERGIDNVCEIMTKPFDLDEFRAAIERCAAA